MKTTLEMALQAATEQSEHGVSEINRIVMHFEALVRADEREACAKLCEQHGYEHYCGNVTDKLAETIRNRGNT